MSFGQRVGMSIGGFLLLGLVFVGGMYVEHNTSLELRTSSSLSNVVMEYANNLTTGNSKAVSSLLRGTALINFQRSPLTKPDPISTTVLNSSVSGPIGSVEAILESGTEMSDQVFTLYRTSSGWKIVNVEYEPWHLVSSSSSVPFVHTAQVVVRQFIVDSARGNTKSGLVLLTGEAYRNTAFYAQNGYHQPSVQLGPITFRHEKGMSPTECGLEADYQTTYNGQKHEHHEWFDVVNVGGVWRIAQVLSV